MDVFDVVNEQLALGTGSSEDLGLEGVELDGLDSAAVLGGAVNEGVCSASSELLGIPQLQRSVLERSGNDTTRVASVGGAPCNVVESVRLDDGEETKC